MGEIEWVEGVERMGGVEWMERMVWMERVPSDCNPADGLSRYGTAFFEQDRAHIA